MSGIYSSAQAADLFGLAESRLRYWAQTGFISPSVRQKGRFYYTFQDLLALKVAKELLDKGLPMQRVRKNLDALRVKLPSVESPLTSMRICSNGDDLVVVDDGVAWQPESGQLVMSFTVGAFQENLGAPPATLAHWAEPPRAATEPMAPPSAYGCFLAGLGHEDAAENARALALYQKAIDLDPNFAAAWTNVGNLLERGGQRGAARAAYERAVELDPDQPEARYNLANLHADLGENELAVAEYRRVLVLSPTFADARYNLELVEDRLREASPVIGRSPTSLPRADSRAD